MSVIDLPESKISGGKPPGNDVANSERLGTSVREFVKASENSRKRLENWRFSAGLRSVRNGLEPDGCGLLESAAEGRVFPENFARHGC